MTIISAFILYFHHFIVFLQVYDTIIVFNAYEETQVGAKDLISRVREYIIAHGTIRNYDGSYGPFTDEDIKRMDDINLAEDFVTRFCMVTQKSRGKIIQAKGIFLLICFLSLFLLQNTSIKDHLKNSPLLQISNFPLAPKNA